MVVPYDPSRFWRVVFARSGSAIPKVLMRACVVLIAAGIACALHRSSPKAVTSIQDTIIMPFETLVTFLLAFRLQDSFSKYKEANAACLDMHASIRKLMSKLCAYTAPSKENDKTIA